VWPIYTKQHFLFPVHALAKVYRGKFIAGLKKAFETGELQFPGELAALSNASEFEHWLDELVAKNWVVYAKAPFSGPAQVVRYVSRYTHRVAISNQRILSIDGGVIRFTYKNYKNQEKGDHAKALWEEMELPANEFIRRFLHHVLPSGYHRIRYYGFLSGSQKHQLQDIWAELVFEEEQVPPEISVTPWMGIPCPKCPTGIMEVLLIVNGRGQVIYATPQPERRDVVDWDRLGLDGWDTS